MTEPLTRRRALAAGLAGLLGTAGCESRKPTFEGGDETSGDKGTEVLRSILERRAKAVRDGNQQAFLADLDQGNAALIQREKLLFQNLSQFRFRDYHYITEKISGGTGDESVRTFSPVIGVAQLEVDQGPGGVAPAEAYQYKVALGGKPVVKDVVRITRANARELNSTAGVYANAPWHVTPLKVIQAGNVWLVADDSVSDLKAYADAARTQAGKVEALWGKRVKFPGYVLFFTRRAGNFRTWFEVGDHTRFEGLEIPLRGVRSAGDLYGEQYAGSRIMVNLAAIEKWGDDPAHVMRHELTHAVTSRASAVIPSAEWLDTPRWAVEGFARWVENLETPARAAAQRAVVAQGVGAGRFTGKPPRSKTFYGRDIQFNYALGSTVFTFADRLKGRDAAIELYAAVIRYADSSDLPVAEAPIFNGICERVLGMGAEAFLSRWAAHVRKGSR